MRRKTVRRVLTILAAMGVGLTGASSIAGQEFSEAVARSRALLEEYLATSGTPGISVAVALGDRVVWAEGVGLADVEHGVEVTPATLFRAWSIAKPMTASAVGLLYERGLVDLDAPIRTYLPSFPEKEFPITLRQLGGHRSGVPHYGDGDLANFVGYESTIQAVDKFKDRPLLFEPGTGFEYSSFGYNLIGAVIESVVGCPFVEFMRTDVFEPLGMRDTRPDRYREVIPNRTGFYQLSETGDIDNAPFTDNSDLWPAGGFLSTPTDLVTFGAGLLGGKLLQPETVELLLTSMGPVEGLGMGYGFGWYVGRFGGPDAGRFIMHSGGHFGGTALLAISEGRPIVTALMVNTTMTDEVFQALFRLQGQIEQLFLESR